jgi:hypothetical protein
MSFIANFKRARDRHALCAYMLTGQLLSAQVGSVVMFGLPDELGSVVEEESFLQTIPLTTLQRAHARADCDVVEICMRIVRAHIADLSCQLARGAITVRLRLAAVTPAVRALHAEIRALAPYTIGWSNDPDYFEPGAFHRMARACSADEDTTHVMHTMNWPLYTHGASHIDLALRTKPEHIAHIFREYVAAVHEGLGDANRVFGWDQVVLHPPNSDVRNILDYLCFLRMHKLWATAFFAQGGFAHAHQTLIVMPPMFSVLHRADSTFIMAFSYDPEVKLHAAATADA